MNGAALNTTVSPDNFSLWTATVARQARYRSSIFSSGLARFSDHFAGRAQQNLAFWARDATTKQFSTVWRVVPTTSSDNDYHLSSGGGALGAIFHSHWIAFSDSRSCADVSLYGARELDVRWRTSVPKQESHHRYYLDSVLSRVPNA